MGGPITPAPFWNSDRPNVIWSFRTGVSFNKFLVAMRTYKSIGIYPFFAKRTLYFSHLGIIGSKKGNYNPAYNAEKEAKPESSSSPALAFAN